MKPKSSDCEERMLDLSAARVNIRELEQGVIALHRCCRPAGCGCEHARAQPQRSVFKLEHTTTKNPPTVSAFLQNTGNKFVVLGKEPT